jgi:hypothetical protein
VVFVGDGYYLFSKPLLYVSAGLSLLLLLYRRKKFYVNI